MRLLTVLILRKCRSGLPRVRNGSHKHIYLRIIGALRQAICIVASINIEQASRNNIALSFFTEALSSSILPKSPLQLALEQHQFLVIFANTIGGGAGRTKLPYSLEILAKRMNWAWKGYVSSLLRPLITLNTALCLLNDLLRKQCLISYCIF